MWSISTRRSLSLCLLASPYLASAAYDNRVIPDEKAGEFTNFRSRPDIRVPIWDIKVYDETRLAPGYWFVSPYENVHPPANDKPPWVTPCIYDTNGELLWSAADIFDHRNTQDFSLSTVLGEPSLTMIWQDGGMGVVMDDHYEKKEEVHIGVNMDTLNIHDWNVVENGTRVLNFKKHWTTASREESKDVGFDGECHAEYQIFYERDATKNWEPVFTWDARDHIPLKDSTFRRNEGPKNVCKGYWDFMHANSVDKCPDGEYVLSARHTDTIYKIQADGKIRWRLGGSRSDFEQDFKFSRQHHVRCHEQKDGVVNISFLDNAVAPDAQPKTHPFSRGLLLAVDERPEKMEASVIATYDHPRKAMSDGRGSMQVLPNKNVLMGWSAGGETTEYTPEGELLMTAKFIPHYLRTYRSYKFPFVGKPQRAPDVLSEVVKSKKTYSTEIYMSWNGATEVKVWNLYKSDANGDTTMLLSSAPKEGFETKMTHDGYASYIVAEALDVNGDILGKSKVITTKPLENMPSDMVSKELQWLKNPTSSAPEASSGGSSTSSAVYGLFFVVGLVITGSIVVAGAVVLRRRNPPWAPQFLTGAQRYEAVDGGEKPEYHGLQVRTPREGGSFSSTDDSRKRSGSLESGRP